MHELKTSAYGKVAEKMETEDDDISWIREEDLSHSVLTLNEVMQTFHTESTSKMFNIKFHETEGQDAEYRTVYLTKNEVQIDGNNKLIVIIRDVSDKVRLE